MSVLKGCPNEKCRAHKRGIKYHGEFDEYCPQCGAELFFVCRSKTCYNRVANGITKFCAECRTQKEIRNDVRKKQLSEMPSKIGPAFATLATVAAALVGVKKNTATLFKKK